MSDIPTREGYASVEALVSPIQGDSPSGVSLRYERLYDDVRDARREDDDTVSYGIWQHDMKRADWGKVESICTQALSTTTKDLQLAGWLVEAWMMLDGIQGLERGLGLIAQLSDGFWDTIHPTIRSGDLEYRSQFYDWLDKTLASRLVSLEFVSNDLGEGISLADWLAAQRLDSVLKRAPDADKLAKKAAERGQITFNQCYTLLGRISTPFGDKYLESLQSADACLIELKTVLDQHFPTNTLAFDALGNHLAEMVRIYKTEMSGRKRDQEMTSGESIGTVQSSVSGEVDTSELLSVGSAQSKQGDSVNDQPSTATVSPTESREQAYKQLAGIAKLLEEIEPHSPAPQLIRRVIAWENKSLMEIFNEMGSSPEDLVALMRFLGIGGNKTSENIPETR